MLASAIPATPVIFLVQRRRWPRRKDLGTRRDLLSGLASGGVQSVAFAGLNLAIGLHLDLTYVNSVSQVSMLVAGLWGLLYGELSGGGAVLLFFASMGLFLGGVALQALYPLSDPHVT